jgi:DeoR family suf operon transcriptional repressor
VSSLPTPDEGLGTALDRLPATRRATLEALRRLGEATADELAEGLGVTSSALRQQLVGLAAEGLVASRPVPSGPGRPRSRWSLTAGGLALFPRAYGQLTTELLGYLDDEDPALVDRLFEQRRHRRTEATLARLGGRPFDERVDDGSWRITEHNCAITDVARRFGQACTSEIQFLRDALPDAEVERVAHMIAGAHVCAYAIRPR